MILKRVSTVFLCAVLIFAFIFNSVGCSSTAVTGYAATDLMKDVWSCELDEVMLDERFVDSQIEFAVRLFKESYSADTSVNTLVSPISVMVALAMTANGADGETLAQFENVLGGGMSINELNAYLCEYLGRLMENENSVISVANSIWFKETETLNVNREFLRDAKLYYGAGAYSAPFDGSTVDDINKWVSDNTNGMIPKMLDSISERELMILLNTVLLQARWNGEYSKDKITEKDFTTIDGIVKRVEMMSSVEKIYIETDSAIGFMKNMSGYKFVAVLPNEDIGIKEYIASLNADEVRKILASDDVRRVYAQLPKFKYDYSLDLKNILVNMGIAHAFSSESANFTRMAETVDKLYFSGIEHKTAIELDEQGIKAAAATAVKLYASAMPGGEKPQEVYVTLDRPFVYFIIDENKGIPVFIGAVTDIGK